MAGRARGYIYTRMEIEEPGAAYKHELELNELRKYAHEAGLEVLDEYADENYGPENIRSWYDFLWMKNAIISHKRHRILDAWDEISRKLWRRWKNFNGVT